MCGIAGFLKVSGLGDESCDLIDRMTGMLIHRGPDDGGVWLDREAGIALGHRRLAIIDLTTEGHQPMHSHCGRYDVVFNGEIYNFQEIRRKLERDNEPISWRGHSDTEVLLAAASAWGVERAVQACVGMFAIAVWDRVERVLWLTRDRIGEKPLYYGIIGDVFCFASELKALRVVPGWDGEPDRQAMTSFFQYGYISAPLSICKGIYKLTPGTYLRMTGKYLAIKSLPSPVPYWQLQQAVATGTEHPFAGSEEEALSRLDRLLSDAVKGQMVSDVPLGAFLSGGIDSSLVVALMQSQSERPVRTFTIGFPDTDFDEADHARNVAQHLGTDHTELSVTPAEALSVIPNLPELYDEPFADSSQIPTALLARLTRNHVTVCLSGDGGDELLGGYERYFHSARLWRSTGWLSPSLRRGLTDLCKQVPIGTWNRLLKAGRLAGLTGTGSNPGDRFLKLLDVLAAPDHDGFYQNLMLHWRDRDSLFAAAGESFDPVTTALDQAGSMEGVSRLMFADTISYLPDDILVKVDRAAMGVGLETRIPFIDHRVVEFAWRLPVTMKVKNGKGKHLLRELLYRYVPRELIDRPKRGFAIPLAFWLRGPLRDWTEALLDEGRLRREGLLDAGSVRQKWEEHLSGRRNWHHQLWDVLMFQAWLEHWRDFSYVNKQGGTS